MQDTRLALREIARDCAELRGPNSQDDLALMTQVISMTVFESPPALVDNGGACDCLFVVWTRYGVLARLSGENWLATARDTNALL